MQRVVFITGASSGIGRSCAVTFARAGFHVTGTARRIDPLHSLATNIDNLPDPHGEFLAVQGDVTNADDLHDAVQQTMDKFGRLDILVANAGVGHRGSIADSEWGDMQTLLRTNIDGVLHSIRACVPAMRDSGGGHIMIVSSVAAEIYSPYAAIYAASKAFVSSIAGSLRLELERDHIKVTDFLIGRTITEFDEKRLGAGSRAGGSLPTMDVEQVAVAIVKAANSNQQRVILRWFDRLIVWGGTFAPWLIGRLARNQYKD